MGQYQRRTTQGDMEHLNKKLQRMGDGQRTPDPNPGRFVYSVQNGST